MRPWTSIMAGMTLGALVVTLGSGTASRAGHSSECPGGSTVIHLTNGDDNSSFGSGRQCVDALDGNDAVRGGVILP